MSFVKKIISVYKNSVIDAWNERKKNPNPQTGAIALTGCILVAAYIIVSIIIVPRGQVREYNFVMEQGSITYLSAILLSMGSGFALVSFLTSAEESIRARVFWFFMAGAIGFLALDELMAFHERVGFKLDGLDTAGILKMLSFGCIRAWNDAVVISYGVVAMGVAFIFLPDFLRFPRLFEYMAVAGTCYFVHTATDSVIDPPNTYSVIFEESCKLFCSTFIALAFLAALLGRIKKLSRQKDQLKNY